MFRRKIILSAIAVLLGAGMLAAQEGRGVALPFTRIDRNPRSAAFAGAGAASISHPGAYQAFRGAAALPFQKGMLDGALGAQFWMPTNEVDQSTNIQGGVALKFGSFGVALGGAYDICLPSGDFTPSDRLVGIGLSYALINRISLGVNARYAAQGLAKDFTVSGFSFDITVLGRITEELSATLGVSTLGTTILAADETPFGQPTYALAGLAWRKLIGKNHAVEAVLDGEYNFDGTFGGALGAEYAYKEMLFARIGYRLAAEYALIPSHLALGLGFQYAGFRADVSFLTLSPLLGNTFSFGIGYSF